MSSPEKMLIKFFEQSGISKNEFAKRAGFNRRSIKKNQFQKRVIIK